ncbi:MAG TPA: ABC-F family ATP-binding cassette domain-containing protein [Gammaproteobacteria bacterium]|nr:ABC-F family ATP-binding cassette domain-containing protein [Gammaproteobacteria bacterium]
MTTAFDIRNACLTLGSHTCLDNVSFSITHGQRIGLIGNNGSGKSSLLNCLAEQLSLDSGRIIRNHSLSTYFLSQSLPDESMNINTYLNSDENPLHSEHLYWVEGINITQPINQLSGGQKQRLKILKAIRANSDILLLDEPTNHLDIASLQSLELWLKDFSGTLITVAHDYAFIHALCTQFLWLRDGTLSRFKGSLTAFMEHQNTTYENEARNHKKLMKKQEREFEWMYKGGVTARRKRNQLRAEAFHQLTETIQSSSPKSNTLKLASSTPPKSGEVLLQAQEISDNHCFKPFDLILRRHDKLAIIGPNGVGKTTLLNCLLGNRNHSGTCQWAARANYSYLDQHQSSLKLNHTLLENLDAVVAGDQQRELMGFLNDFQFDFSLAHTLVRHFSGGQKQRACLAQLLLRPTNLLILDEPTNDLDLMSVEVLIDYLEQYKGALILITHNRRLIDQVANKILHLPPSGDIIIDHTLNRQYMINSTEQKPKNNTATPEKKGSGKKAHDIRKILKKIDLLETQLKKINLQLNDPKLYINPDQKLTTLNEKKSSIEEELQHYFEDWSNLEE